MKIDTLKNKFIVYSFDLESNMFNNYLGIFQNKNFSDININDFAAKEMDKENTIFTINNRLITIMQNLDALKKKIDKNNINSLPIEFQDYSRALA